jgi:hypothetical protein
MATLYVPGPTEISVNFGDVGGTLYFLGYTEREVQIHHQAQFENVFCDVSGPSVPFDVAYMGETGMALFDLKVYNESVFLYLARRIQSRANSNPTAVTNSWAAHPDGTVLGGSVGTLMRTENAAVEMLFRCRYASKSVFNSNLMKPAYRFYRCWLAESYEVRLSTSTKAIRCHVQAIPYWNAVDGAGVLYTDNPFGAPVGAALSTLPVIGMSAPSPPNIGNIPSPPY